MLVISASGAVIDHRCKASRVGGGGGEVEELLRGANGTVHALHLAIHVALPQDDVEAVADVSAVGAEARRPTDGGRGVPGRELHRAEAAAGLAALAWLHSQLLNHRGCIAEGRPRARDRQAAGLRIRHLQVAHDR